MKINVVQSAWKRGAYEKKKTAMGACISISTSCRNDNATEHGCCGCRQEEGEAKQKLRVATLMLAKGCYSLQEISELTKLSIEDIEKLEKEMHATE